MRIRTVICALLLSVAPDVAGAQDSLTANDFNIDIASGPVLGSNRIVAMGGAFTAVSQGVDAAPWNPAAYGSRTLWEPNWFEWDASAGLMLPGSFSQNDFFNNGRGEGIGVDEFVFLDTALRLQFANLGSGFLYRINSFNVNPQGQSANVDSYAAQLGAAWMFLGGDLVVGLGGLAAGMSIALVDEGTQLVSFGGLGAEAGAVYRPEGLPFRIGLAGRTPVYSEQIVDEESDEAPVEQVLGFVLPKQVHMPWEARLGLAWQFGNKPFNRRWRKPVDPTDRLKSRMKARWCERERARASLEVRAQGRADEEVGQCPRLKRRPRDRDWWREEEKLREQEQVELEERIEREREDLEKRSRRDYEVLPRYYWLVTADLVVTGQTPDGIGLDAFLDQERRRSGERLSWGVRLGTEVEAWPNRMKIRIGGYLEPARNTGVSPRIHGTAGMDFRLFTWDLFGWVEPFSIRAGGMVDLAVRYFNWGFGIGMWH